MDQIVFKDDINISTYQIRINQFRKFGMGEEGDTF